jgi:hypothetical protein
VWKDELHALATRLLRQYHHAMLLWNLINTLLGLIALAIAVWGVTANVRQYNLAKKQDEEAKKLAKEDETWSLEFERVAKNLAKIGNRFTSGGKTYGQGVGYDLVFPDMELRQRIEAHLIQRNSNRDMQVRSLPNEQLRLPHVRKTITDVLDALERIKKEHPDLAAAMGILERNSLCPSG